MGVKFIKFSFGDYLECVYWGREARKFVGYFKIFFVIVRKVFLFM